MPKPDIYKFGDFYKRVDRQSMKQGSLHHGIAFTRDLVPNLDPNLPLTDFVYREGTLRLQATPEIDLIPNVSLTHFVQFRIENDPLFDLRDLAIELYSNSELNLTSKANPIIRVFLRTTSAGERKGNLMRWYTTFLEEHKISSEDYSFNCAMGCIGGSQENALTLHNIGVFKAFIQSLKNKIPQATDLIKDLDHISEFMEDPTKNFAHSVLKERTFFIDEENEYLNRLFHLVGNYYERDGVSTSDFSGTWSMLPAPGKKAPIIVQQSNSEKEGIQQFYLVRHKKSGIIRLLNTFGKAPFAAYATQVRQNYELVYESSLASAYLDIEGNGPNPNYPLFKKINGRWALARATVPQVRLLPIKEFDWLVSRARLHPDQLCPSSIASWGCDTLLDYIVRNKAADCLGTLLAYGFEPHTAFARHNLKTLYETIYDSIKWMTTEHLQQCTDLHKMWSYFQPTLKGSLSNKKTGVTSVSLRSTAQQINSTFVTLYQDQQPIELETVFKPATLLSEEEKTLFSSLVEASFDSLITEQDKLEFSAVAAKSAALTSSEADGLWCDLIEKRFKCTLSPEKRKKFLALMSVMERDEFYQLIPFSSTSDEFWNLVKTSLVRFSFNKDISGANKFVELVYKKSSRFVGNQHILVNELIAGTVHELLDLPRSNNGQDKPIIIWHYALAAKRALSADNRSSKLDYKDHPGYTPQGLMQFLMFRGALSLGLKYDVAVIGFTLNTSSHAFVAELNNYFPKKRSESVDNFVLKVIRAIYGNDVIIHQDGMAYYIQENTQAKTLGPGKPLSQHLFNKFNGMEPDAEPQARYRAVPTLFSGSRKENRDQLTQFLPPNESQKHLYGFFNALEPIVATSIQPCHSSLAKL